MAVTMDRGNHREGVCLPSLAMLPNFFACNGIYIKVSEHKLNMDRDTHMHMGTWK